MIVVEVDDPRSKGSRCYIGEDDANTPYTLSTDLQKAHVFIQAGDRENIPWPSEQPELDDLMTLLSLHKPTQIQVNNCNDCASVKFIDQPCPICSHRKESIT